MCDALVVEGPQWPAELDAHYHVICRCTQRLCCTCCSLGRLSQIYKVLFRCRRCRQCAWHALQRFAKTLLIMIVCWQGCFQGALRASSAYTSALVQVGCGKLQLVTWEQECSLSTHNSAAGALVAGLKQTTASTAAADKTKRQTLHTMKKQDAVVLQEPRTSAYCDMKAPGQSGSD